MENSIIFTEKQLTDYTTIVGLAFVNATAEHFKASLTIEDLATILPKAQQLALFHLHTPTDKASVN